MAEDWNGDPQTDAFVQDEVLAAEEWTAPGYTKLQPELNSYSCPAQVHFPKSAEPDKAFGDIRRVTFNLAFHPHLLYASFALEAHISKTWTDKTGSMHQKETIATRYFTRHNFKDVGFVESGPGDGTEVLKPDVHKYLRQRRTDGNTITRVTIFHDNTNPLGTVFNTPGAEAFPVIKEVADILNTTDTIEFFMEEKNLKDRVDQIRNMMEAEKENNPYGVFFNEEQKKAQTIQLGISAPQHERPQTKMPVSLSFPEPQAYFVSIFQSRLREHEIEQKQIQKYEGKEYDARGIVSTWSNGRFFVVLDLGDEGRIAPGSVLDMKFRVPVKEDTINKGTHQVKKKIPLTAHEKAINKAAISYTGVVIDPVYGGAMGDTTVCLDLAWDAGKKKYQMSPFPAPLDLKLVAKKSLLNQAVSHTPTVKCAIHVQSTWIPLRRCTNAIRRLQQTHRRRDNAEHESTALKLRMLLGNDFRDLPRYNLYRNLQDREGAPPVKEYLRNLKQGLNKDQREVISSLSDQQGFASFTLGPPGTGKTHVAIAAALPLINYESADPNNQEERFRNQVVMTAPTNILASEMAVRVNRIVQQREDDRDIMVVRSHVVETEVGIAKHHPKAINRPQDPSKPPIHPASKLPTPEQLEKTELEAARMVYEYSQTIDLETSRGVKDARVLDVTLSLAWRMLQMAGLVDEGNPFQDHDNEQWAEFIPLYTQWQRGAEMTKDNEKKLNECIRNLRKAVLNRADVVCATVTGLGESAIYESLHPDLLIVDEASRMLEAEALITVAWFNCQTMFIGDYKQTKPNIQMSSENIWRKQCEMSLLERMMKAGYPSHMLRTQYRMHPEIGDMVSELFYDGELEHDPTTKFQDGLDKGRMFHEKEFGIASQLALVNLPHSDEDRTPTQSKLNVYHTNYIAALVTRMIERYGIPAEEIAVVVPYEGQWKAYRAVLSALDKHLPQHGASRIRLEKVDSIMGRQFPHVVADIPNTRDIGFLKYSGRINVMVSRSQKTLTIVTNRSKLELDKNAWVMKSIFRYCFSRNLIRRHTKMPLHYEEFIQTLPPPEHHKVHKEGFKPIEPKGTPPGTPVTASGWNDVGNENTSNPEAQNNDEGKIETETPPPPPPPEDAPLLPLEVIEAPTIMFYEKPQIIPTSGYGLLCGLYAIVNSMEHQHPNDPQPSVQGLQDQLKIVNANANNFNSDELAIMLYEWGQTVQQVYQLGIYLDEKTQYLVPIPDTDSEIKVVWVHNNQGQDSGGLGHWSGLREVKVLVTRWPTKLELEQYQANKKHGGPTGKIIELSNLDSDPASTQSTDSSPTAQSVDPTLPQNKPNSPSIMTGSSTEIWELEIEELNQVMIEGANMYLIISSEEYEQSLQPQDNATEQDVNEESDEDGESDEDEEFHDAVEEILDHDVTYEDDVEVNDE